MSAIANSNQPEEKPKTSRVPSWRTIPWKKLASLLMAIALCFYLTACGGGDKKQTASKSAVNQVEVTKVKEVSPPDEIQRLSRLMERYNPQVNIVSPKPEEILNDTQVSVKFDVKNLPIFKNAEFGLGPHIHITLDNQEYKALYDLGQPVTFDRLSAGTHTIRAFASRPWHESFKNKGAYAQVTFHVLTKTGENTPDTKTPAITYSRPVGVYGAEPVMLDFYIQNAPVHSLVQDEPNVEDWQVRATVNGQSFTFDRWEPIYLKGFKNGKNWVKLELLEDDGDPIPNAFNSSAHLIDFQPNGSDTLSRIVRGEKIANIDAIADPNYVPPAPEVIPAPPEAIPSPDAKSAPASTESSQVVAPTVPTAEAKEAKDAKPAAEVKTEIKSEPKATPKVEKSDKVESAPTSVIPVVPVPVAPVVAPVKVTPIKVIPKAEPVKVAPIVPIKVEPVKSEPVKSEPIEPVKIKSNPLAAPIKVAPVVTAPKATPLKVSPIPVKTTPIVEPTKAAPTKIQSRFNSVPEIPKVIAKPATPAAIVPPKAKEESPVKVETPKDNAPEKLLLKTESKTEINKAEDYLKNFSFDPRKIFSPKKEEITSVKGNPADVKPSEKPEVKAPEVAKTAPAKTDAKSETKPTKAPPALTDLSTTTTSPIKVLTTSK
ncbi:hypothetical protein H6F42_01985 [Pseudanabaena sp. FACHB-1998]|uniref:hypothetical protein n=1 Tax=Pseudanabaena sp. FACHB-1998 TaxID=2692858 RepID=UPI0016803B92|nr:hypothetical protein [Pseudanabaena sp. FACHB-1998]MBD2175688.1 hypothetical protein [Pseudanabaena sp. FACHB-1998]